jgi:hypothetical protein
MNPIKTIIYSAREGYLYSNRKGAISIALGRNIAVPQSKMRSGRNILSVCEDCRFLMVELTTQFEDFLETEKIDSHLRDFFGESREKLGYYIWETLYTHDSNTGSVQKILLVFPPKSLAGRLPWQDYWIPAEMYLVGLAEKIFENGEQNFLLVALHQNQQVIIAMNNSSLVYFTKEPWRSDEHLQMRIGCIRNYLMEDPSFKDVAFWKVFYFQEQLDFLHDPPLKAKKLGKTITGENEVLFGLLEFCKTDYLSNLNLLEPLDAEVPHKKRELYKLGMISSFTLIVLICVFFVYLFIHAGIKKQYLDIYNESKIFEEQLAKLNYLESSITHIERSVESYPFLWHPPYQWHRFLGNISSILPRGGQVAAFGVRRNGNMYSVTFQVIVNNWDQVRPLENQLHKMDPDRTKSIVIRNLRKRDETRVSFDVQMELE